MDKLSFNYFKTAKLLPPLKKGGWGGFNLIEKSPSIPLFQRGRLKDERARFYG